MRRPDSVVMLRDPAVSDGAHGLEASAVQNLRALVELVLGDQLGAIMGHAKHADQPFLDGFGLPGVLGQNLGRPLGVTVRQGRD